MGKIAIVTDSTADLNTELIEQYNITVVPLNVHFHDEVFKDGVDMTTTSFFKKLKDTPVPPRTSQPSPGDFQKVYKSLLSSGYQSIISIHISSNLSGTWQSACIARDMLPEEQIQIVNSKSASMGLGLIVINTVKRIQEGASLEDAASYANQLVDNSRIMFAVDTLEYLHRNGRIGRAAKLMGGLLNVKPMLYVDNGVVAPLGKVRGKSKVIPFLVEQAEKFVGDFDGPMDLAVIHAQDPAIAQEITAKVTEKLKIRDVYQSEIGSVIGTHTGPGAVGITLQKC
jgi:DegV family protein with EDD domain